MLFFFNDTAATENYALTHSFPTRRSADLHVFADAGIGDEVGFDVGACLGLIDAELPGEAERADAVDDAETNGFGLAADHRVHAGDRHPEHLGEIGRAHV